VKIAWLIEINRDGTPVWYCMVNGEHCWTEDANRACKFADEGSAEQIMSHPEFPEDAEAAEHSWPDET